MAVTASGLFYPTWAGILNSTQYAVDLNSETNLKCAMFTNSITPDFSANTAYGSAPYNANEVSGAGYSAGGFTLTSTTVSESPSGTLMFDAVDATWANSTISNARCALVYDNSLTPKVAICLVNFGADYSTNAGLFTIQWASGGIFNIDLTP